MLSRPSSVASLSPIASRIVARAPAPVIVSPSPMIPPPPIFSWGGVDDAAPSPAPVASLFSWGGVDASPPPAPAPVAVVAPVAAPVAPVIVAAPVAPVIVAAPVAPAVIIAAPAPVPRNIPTIAHRFGENRAVGTLYKGYPILDRENFENRIVAQLNALGGFNGLNGYNTPVRSGDGWGLEIEGALFWLYGFDASPFVQTGGSGESFTGPDVWDTAGLAAAYRVALQSPNARFLFLGPRVDYVDPTKDLVKVIYVRYRDVMVPLAAMLVYSASDWVGWRGGVEFVIVGTFGAVVAPFISAELTALVTDGAETATLGATQASLITSFSSSAAQLSGNQDVALAGKIVNAISGDFSSVAADTSADGLAQAFQGESMDWDPFNFSSGESIVAFSDAQNVDFGFGNLDPASYDLTGLDINGFGGVQDVGSFGDGVYDYNVTPEVTTSDYGTQFEPAFGADTAKDAATVVAKAAAPAAQILTRPQTGQKATSGPSGAKAASSASGPMDMVASLANGIGSTVAALGTAVQAVNATGTPTYAGQLTPAGGQLAPGTIGGFSTSTILIAGAVLIGVALILHAKGG